MREVLVIARCDECGQQMEPSDDPLPKWVVDGVTYRPELCDTCKKTVLTRLAFLKNSAIQKREKGEERKPSGPKVGRGRYSRIPSKCEMCERTFATPAGLAIHMSSQHDVKQDKPKGDTSRLDCRWCGKTFKSPSGRAGHEVSGHRAEWNKMKKEGAKR